MRNHQSKIFTNDQCTGCNRCVAACPMPEANYAVLEEGKNKIYVNAEKCINCGKCMETCPSHARDYFDDTEEFLAKLNSGRISVVAAPAIRSNFSGYEHLLGALRSMGARYLYDASFGADICTWAYIRHIQQTGATGLIAQSCPVVVNYIEKYNPGLIPFLAPIHSPALCTAIFMRHYRGIDGEIALLSPCIAKKDEFQDPNTSNQFQYNITFRKLAAALEKRGIDYRNYPIARYDNEQHGMGSIYSMPGGLRINIHRFIPDVWIYQAEGQPQVKRFLDEYEDLPDASKPFLANFLNCTKGCNIGTGGINDIGSDLAVSQVMYNVQKTAALGQKGFFKKNHSAGKTLEEFDQILKLEDFYRKYTAKKVCTVDTTRQQIENAFHSLYKNTEDSRKIDCGACGYRSCEAMATAIAKEMNHAENCVDYHKSVLSARQKEIGELLLSREEGSRDLVSTARTIFDSLSENAGRAENSVRLAARVDEEVLEVRETVQRLARMVDTLGTWVNRYAALSSDMIGLSTRTKLLSKNALVEAAYAKEMGKGLAVVAGEMKELSDQSAASAREIIANNDMVIPMLEEARAFSEALEERTENISDSTREILEVVRQIDQTERKVTEAAARIVHDDAMH